MQLRDLLPSRTFDITTCWSPEVAIVELKKRVDKGGMLFGGTGTAPFVGRVRGTSDFELRRRLRGQNAFLPVIRVVVEPWHRGGARLGVTMRLHAFVALFMAVWMTGATVGALAVVIAGNCPIPRRRAPIALGWPSRRSSPDHACGGFLPISAGLRPSHGQSGQVARAGTLTGQAT